MIVERRLAKIEIKVRPFEARDIYSKSLHICNDQLNDLLQKFSSKTNVSIGLNLGKGKGSLFVNREHISILS